MLPCEWPTPSPACRCAAGRGARAVPRPGAVPRADCPAPPLLRPPAPQVRLRGLSVTFFVLCIVTFTFGNV